MTRDEARALVEKTVSNRNLVKHMIATEAAMRQLAIYFDDDEDTWGLTGLLHDLDYDETQSDFAMHGVVAARMLEKLGLDKKIIQAVRAHVGHKGYEPKSRMDWALYAVDPLTGLIVAAALMHPKGLKEMDANFVMRRFEETRFAAGANRDQIKKCAKIGLELDDFITITLNGMKKVANLLGI
ncbi:HDIG domain-containing protein [bacterium]|nr:HDIG domain-containing protein [bacterium]